ncbi:hypothetical protein Tco_1508886 [Tanacetum coccineum]
MIPLFTYTLLTPEARSLEYSSEDPNEDRLPYSCWSRHQFSRVVPDPMELEDHVPVYIPEPEHPEDLVPAEDEAPTPLLPPSFLSPPVRAEIEVLRRERLAYEQESIQTRQDLARSEAHCRALEAQVTVLETNARRHEWQRQAADDLDVQYIMHTQTLEAGARVDTLEDALKWHQKEPQGQHGPQQQHQPQQQPQPLRTGELRDATRNGTDSHSSGTGVRGSERVARECTYQDFMKCKPLYFKGTEGVVELTQWFERMETVFRISNCSVENQVKFSTCTLLASALNMVDSHV